jgi:H+/Cl- antiporter ClcA
MIDPDDWGTLQAVWQSRPTETVVDAQFKAEVAQARRRMLVEAGLEALVALGSAAVLVWWADDAQGTAQTVLLVVAAMSLATLLATSLARRRLWRARGSTLASYRRFLAAQAHLGLRLAWLGVIGGPLGLAFGMWLGDRFQFGERLNNIAVVAMAVLMLVTSWLWSLREIRRCRRQLAGLAAADDTE